MAFKLRTHLIIIMSILIFMLIKVAMVKGTNFVRVGGEGGKLLI